MEELTENFEGERKFGEGEARGPVETQIEEIKGPVAEGSPHLVHRLQEKALKKSEDENSGE